jgi:hypothetical protein
VAEGLAHVLEWTLLALHQPATPITRAAARPWRPAVGLPDAQKLPAQLLQSLKTEHWALAESRWSV